jgi:hypothetical protein
MTAVTKVVKRWQVLMLTILLLSPVPAFAYIDPNAGGMLYQLLFPLLAAIVSIYVFLKQWIIGLARRIWAAIARRFRSGP